VALSGPGKNEGGNVYLLSELVIGICGNKEQTNAAIAEPHVDKVLLQCIIFTGNVL
jgi:hypothetical protein